MQNLPIVILPGWMLSASRYKQLASEFSNNGYTVNIADFPGFADGPELRKVYNLTDYVKYLNSWLKKQGISKAVFVCHSFGGRVAIKFLSQNPRFCTRLIISGTPGFVPVSKPKLWIFFTIAKIGGKVFSLPGLRSFKNHIRKMYYKIIGAKDFYHTQGLIRETFKNIIKEPLDDYMRKIKIPTLLLWGGQDKTVPVKIAKRMNKVMVNSELIIFPEMNHGFIFNEPVVFVNAVMKYLRKDKIPV